MFLNRLKKKEKVAFLELAHHIARSDSDFSESQKSIISKYCMEMKISDIKYNENKFDLEKTLSKFKSKSSQKISLLEVMALVYSDDILHIEEKKVLTTMIKQFGLKDSLAVIYSQWSKSILALYIQGQALIDL
ncbi:MAG: hypothetical protein DRG78_12950 [Epsilonproteobacteria bacterium]|nr:MAG: hypothetical protein DRG78_12950 [Campylobacterota bacterium]